MMRATVDEDLHARLVESFGTDDVVILDRRPYEYATSFPLEELQVEVDGRSRMLIRKDLAWDRLLPAAQGAKPSFLHDPRRSIRAQALAAEAGFAPPLQAAGGDWIVMDKISGVELWQVGEHQVWSEAVRALARFHRRAAHALDEISEACPQLLRYDDAWFLGWADRAADVLGRSQDPRAARLVAVLGGYGDVVGRLSASPSTFVHGEFFASNVMVGTGAPVDRVVAVDWEMAATGPGALDLAAVAVGWDDEIRHGFVADYHDERPTGSADDLATEVDCGLLHLSLQWLGWNERWEPPTEHRRDWIGEALAAAERLGL